MDKIKNRGSFSGRLGFVLAAAGSAVGLGNIWRFPTLAARYGGGVFLLCYIALVFTFGFALLSTEIAIGRKTGVGPYMAYRKIHPKFKWLGKVATIIPAVILPYYCAIGGWILKYLVSFATGQGQAASADGYFGSFITSVVPPVVYMAVFIGLCAFIVFSGVKGGIEKSSKYLMPILLLLVIGISIFSLTIKIEAGDGSVRTGLQGLKFYMLPRLEGLTFSRFCEVLMAAVGQLFYSISVAMGIMVAYGSYVPKDSDIQSSISYIEIFDTMVAILAGMMIVPAVYAFSDVSSMSAGPGLIFVSLPKIFMLMGKVGVVVAVLFFVLVSFAALTSAVSIMEAIISSLCDRTHMARKKACAITVIYGLVIGIVVCLGYNLFYFELKLPNGAIAQILDLMDYVSNNVLMPVVAIATCILIGWVVKCNVVLDELKIGSKKLHRQKLYVLMTKFIVPIILLILLVQAFIH